VHRFYAPAFAADTVFELPADEARHVSRVLRLRAGDAIAVFDGQGREAVARVETVSATRVSVKVVEPRAPAPEPQVRVTLAQALLKSDKMDRVIRDAVMLGVAAVQPFVSRRTDVPIKAVADGGRQDRWDRTVISSVKQCGRAVVPLVHPTKALHDVLASTAAETRLMFVEPNARAEVGDLTKLEGQRPSTAMVLIGPEGGWDAAELDAAVEAGVTLVTLGRRTLRADAAAAAAIAVLQYVWRDL
jgi:16S rRNA (uracil1498-N3)-methyltransferase